MCENLCMQILVRLECEHGKIVKRMKKHEERDRQKERKGKTVKCTIAVSLNENGNAMAILSYHRSYILINCLGSMSNNVMLIIIFWAREANLFLVNSIHCTWYWLLFCHIHCVVVDVIPLLCYFNGNNGHERYSFMVP